MQGAFFTAGRFSPQGVFHNATACLILALVSILAFYSCCRSDSDCDDGLFCNGKEFCLNLFCQTGAPPDCSDGVGCTDDKCDEAADSCENVPNNALCSDPYYCTVNERCDPVRDCVTDPKDCGDTVACTRDECDEDAEACTHAPDHAFCADEFFCDGDELCDPAAGDPATGCLEPSSPRDCSDGIECTVDACDEAAGACAHQPDDEVCQDGIFCNGPEVCDPVLNPDSGCVDGDDPTCDDGIDCTFDYCDPGADACASSPDDSLCDDANPCTQNVCTLGLGCEYPHEPDGTPCPPYDGTTICVAGACVMKMCGDGFVEPLDSEMPAEECDDGNADDADGCTSLCRSLDFQANTSEPGEERNPGVAVAQDGSFVIVFEDETYLSPSYTDARFRRFDHHGLALDAEDRLLSESAAGIQIEPDAARLPDGGFAAVWADSAGSGDLFDIKLRLFDSTGAGSAQLTVNTSTFGPQRSPRVNYFPVSGDIVVLWEDQAGLEGELKLRRYDPSGFPVDAAERSLPAEAMAHRSQPDAAESPAGTFLVVWTGSSDGLATGIFARLFNAAAEPESQVIEISSSACYQNYGPSLSWHGEAADGYFILAWERICPDSVYPVVAAAVMDPVDVSIVAEPGTISPATEENFSPVITTTLTLAVPHGGTEAPVEQWVTALIWAGTSDSAAPTDAPYDVFGQRFIVEDGAIIPFDPLPLALSTTTRFEQNGPASVFNAAGDLVISWTDFSREGSDVSYSSVRARYLPNGWLIE